MHRRDAERAENDILKLDTSTTTSAIEGFERRFVPLEPDISVTDLERIDRGEDCFPNRLAPNSHSAPKAASYSKELNTSPVSSLGKKNVLFGGIFSSLLAICCT